MSKLPPVEKFPLAVRKDIRDGWEVKKDQIVSELSSLLGTEWAAEVDFKQIYAYAAPDSYGQRALGSCVFDHFDSNIRRLREFLEYQREGQEAAVAEINAICHAHILTIDVDLDSRFTYNGCDVLDGRLRILFEPTCIDTNIGQSFERDVLLHALNDGDKDVDGTGLSFIVRQAKRTDYDTKIEAVRKGIAEALAREDIKLTPNFQDTYAKLKVEAARSGTDLNKQHWETQTPEVMILYFEGLLSQLKWQKFNEDDMLQEGFNETVESGEIAFRLVDTLKYKSYCEFEIENGVFYLQCTPQSWGTNITSAAEGIIDKL